MSSGVLEERTFRADSRKRDMELRFTREHYQTFQSDLALVHGLFSIRGDHPSATRSLYRRHIPLLPADRSLQVKSTVSNTAQSQRFKTNLLTLTFAASKIFMTAVEISGPIPSPGIRVTVCICGVNTDSVTYLAAHTGAQTTRTTHILLAIQVRSKPTETL